MKAIIVYFSAYGHVKQMVEKTKEGLKEAGLDITTVEASKADPNDLLDYDAVVLGSPVRMGSIGDEMKAFIDKLGGLWLKAALNNRVGGILVSGGGFNSGVEMTQIALNSTLIELGMFLTGFPNNLPGYGNGANQWGPYAKVGLDGKEGPSEDCLTACFEYGKRIGWLTQKVRG